MKELIESSKSHEDKRAAARLADYKVASKERLSMSDFKQDPALQERVVRWHIADIDEAIDALGDKASG